MKSTLNISQLLKSSRQGLEQSDSRFTFLVPPQCTGYSMMSNLQLFDISCEMRQQPQGGTFNLVNFVDLQDEGGGIEFTINASPNNKRCSGSISYGLESGTTTAFDTHQHEDEAWAVFGASLHGSDLMSLYLDGLLQSQIEAYENHHIGQAVLSYFFSRNVSGSTIENNILLRNVKGSWPFPGVGSSLKYYRDFGKTIEAVSNGDVVAVIETPSNDLIASDDGYCLIISDGTFPSDPGIPKNLSLTTYLDPPNYHLVVSFDAPDGGAADGYLIVYRKNSAPSGKVLNNHKDFIGTRTQEVHVLTESYDSFIVTLAETSHIAVYAYNSIGRLKTFHKTPLTGSLLIV